jgi:ubiquitin-conjugating enzyme E2 variant
MSYPLWLNLAERLALGVSLLCALGIAAAIHADATTPLDALLLAAACVAGYFFADFVTGFVHWAGDRLGTPATPVLGPALIAPFRAHHDEPKEMTRHGFIELCGASFILVAPAWVLTWLLPSELLGARASLTLRAFMLSLGLFTGITNQLHCWAHASANLALVAWLQRLRVILPPEIHALHHAPPYEGHYCVTNGWCNRLLLRSGFFERLESWLGVR